MDMQISQSNKLDRPLVSVPSTHGHTINGFSRQQLLARLGDLAGADHFQTSLRIMADYVGASHYLLVRCDLIQEDGLDFVVSSNWPFDLVRRLASDLAGGYLRAAEVERCLILLQPSFALLPEDAELPEGTSRQYSAVMFNVGRSRFALMLLCRDGVVVSPEKLRDIGLLAGYFASFRGDGGGKAERDFELTEREIECLFWIAEGKTSDEIAVILGISRNTINNYITSVMRKTATKTRSEAIAFAVRNNLV